MPNPAESHPSTLLLTSLMWLNLPTNPPALPPTPPASALWWTCGESRARRGTSGGFGCCRWERLGAGGRAGGLTGLWVGGRMGGRVTMNHAPLTAPRWPGDLQEVLRVLHQPRHRAADQELHSLLRHQHPETGRHCFAAAAAAAATAITAAATTDSTSRDRSASLAPAPSSCPPCRYSIYCTCKVHTGCCTFTADVELEVELLH
jgi:hypothetical protein